MEKKIEEQFLKLLEDADLSHNNEYLKERQREYIFYRALIKNIDYIDISKMEDDSKLPSEEIIEWLYYAKISFSERFFKPKTTSLYWIKHKMYEFLELVNYPEIKLSNLDFDSFQKAIYNNHEVSRMKLFLFSIIFHEKHPTYSEKFMKSIDEFLHLASYGDCQFIIYNLLTLYEKAYPELKNKRNLHREQKTILESSTPEEDTDVENDAVIVPMISTEEITKILLENIQLKDQISENEALIDFYRSSNKQKQKELNTFMEEGEKYAKIKVFQSMNSMQSNQTLDNFYTAKMMYDDLLKRNWTPDPPELAEILYIIQLFDAFLNSQSVLPMHEIGETLSINLEDAKIYDYRGTEFISDSEIKTVKIKTPGWKFEDEIISKPSVVEVKKKET